MPEVVAAPPPPPTPVAVEHAPAPAVPSEGGDPWMDPKWVQYKWTVYRGVAYDLTAFMERHPAGSFLLRLAIGRDCTALFESYHMRPEVASARLQRLPVLAGFPVEAVPRSPYPNDSEIYNTIRQARSGFAGRQAGTGRRARSRHMCRGTRFSTTGQGEWRGRPAAPRDPPTRRDVSADTLPAIC